MVGGAQRLVRDRPERERCDVRPAELLDPLARAERPTLELVLVGDRRDEGRLLDERRSLARLGPERVEIAWDLAPALDLDPLGTTAALDEVTVVIAAQEHHREARVAVCEEARDRQQDAGAVAGLAVGDRGAAVAHATESLDDGLHQRPRRAARGVGDEADAAGVDLARRVVESGGARHEGLSLEEVSAVSVG